MVTNNELDFNENEMKFRTTKNCMHCNFLSVYELEKFKREEEILINSKIKKEEKERRGEYRNDY